MQKVLDANIWHPHFKLDVLECDMVSFTESCLFWTERGRQSFESPCKLFKIVKLKNNNLFLHFSKMSSNDVQQLTAAMDNLTSKVNELLHQCTSISDITNKIDVLAQQSKQIYDCVLNDNSQQQQHKQQKQQIQFQRQQQQQQHHLQKPAKIRKEQHKEPYRNPASCQQNHQNLHPVQRILPDIQKIQDAEIKMIPEKKIHNTEQKHRTEEQKIQKPGQKNQNPAQNNQNPGQKIQNQSQKNHIVEKKIHNLEQKSDFQSLDGTYKYNCCFNDDRKEKIERLLKYNVKLYRRVNKLEKNIKKFNSEQNVVTTHASTRCHGNKSSNHGNSNNVNKSSNHGNRNSNNHGKKTTL